MYLFWESILQPIFETLQPKNITEIGSDHGHNTRNLLAYCQQHNAKLHVIDPLPKYDVSAWQDQYGELVVFHLSLSLNAIPLIKEFDVVLIDGDHNWYTVFNELKLIEKSCQERDQSFPLIILHDISWPYGRRDLYYNPDNIPEAYRQPYQQKGMRFGVPDLIENGGLNSHLNNSIYEHSLQNGVLTAVEDFLKETQQSIDLIKIPGLHGLGILIPRQLQQQNQKFADLMTTFKLPLTIEKFIGQIEEARLRSEIERQESQANINKIKTNHQSEIEQLTESHNHRFVRLHNEYQSEIKQLTESHNHQIEDLKAEHQSEIKQLTESHNHRFVRLHNEHQSQLEQLTNNHKSELQSQANKYQNQIESLCEQNKRLEQQLHSLQNQLDRDIISLSNLLRQFDALVTSMVDSNRWKLGNLMYTIYRKILLKPLDPPPKEHYDKIRIKVKKWEERIRNRSFLSPVSLKSLEPQNKVSKYEKNKEPNQQSYSLQNQHDQELIYLSNLLKKFDTLVTSVINSNRWKIGNLLYTIYRKVFLQTLDPSLQECQDELRNKIKKWEQRQKRKQNIVASKISSKQNIKSSLLLTSSLTEQFSQLKVEKSVSVIILNLNGAKHLNKLLDSLLIHNDYKNFNIIIVDHNSQDGSLKVIDSYKQKLPIKVIPYKENYSYSYSNNRAVDISDSEYLIFLNNDIIFTENIIARIVTYLQDEKVGIVGAKLVYPEYDSKFPNEIQHSGIKFFEDIEHDFYRPYNLGVKSGNCNASDLVQVVPAVTGALMACRRQEFLEIGGFCEDYFYGYEDVDLCLTYLDQLNKLSISNNKVVAVHDESSTQKLDPSKKVQTRRQNNQAVLSKRYGYALKKAWWQDLILGHNFWSNSPLVIAFAVTEASEQAKAGDYFTALELGSTCASQFGWKIEFLARDRDWYDLSDVDILIVMVDAYDLSKIYNSKPGLIKVAWLRNWFERWSERDCFEDYDIYLCSSKKATTYIQEEYSKVAHTFMLATNESRFKSGKVVDKFVSDYCFTGSFWNVNRDIVNVLEPQKIEYQFALYGSGWDKNKKLCSYWRGFIPYTEIPDIYSSTKIVIDDANHVTKPWGSVNSRVFDALASGALVITNGIEGATEVFDGILPSYETPEELHSLLNFYLSNDNERISITSQLKEKVLDKHTYTHRACQLQSILSDFCQNKFRIAIKVPVPKIEEVHEWGDYHLALALKRAFKKHGHSVRIDILPDWDTQLGFGDDLVLVLRGLSEYTPKPNHINLMWNISHPDKVSYEEYERYDHIFVASHHYADKLSKKITTPVSTLLQCTDPSIFYPETNNNIPQEEVLFVGNSRKQFRTIIKDALEVGLQVSVYGTRWENIIPSTYHKGSHIENRKLHYYYSKCKILLNDHWPSMKENGFISNRIFDAAACGCFVISDDVMGASDIFGDTLVTYKNASELKQLVDYFLEHEQERKLIGNKLKKIVLSEHTFEHRAQSILDILNKINEQKLKLNKLHIVKENTKNILL